MSTRKYLPLLCLSLATSCVVNHSPGGVPHPASWVTVNSLTQPQKLTLLALQGLKNRTGPNVILDFGEDNRWMRMDYTEKPGQDYLLSWNPQTPEAFKARYPTIALAWREILQERSLFTFTPQTWESFLATAGDEVNGWIVYDDFEEEVALVATMAGQLDALPVLRGDLAAMENILPGRPVVFDANTVPTIQGIGRKVSVHQWMITNVLPRVNKSGLVSRVKNYQLEEHDTFVDIDQAVQERWLVYDLTHYRDDLVAKPDPKLSRPDETDALMKILEGYPPLTLVYGWGASDEVTLVRALTEKGLALVCSGVPNNSFFNQWKAARLPLRQRYPHVPEDAVTLENKVYIAFMVNEGDSIKNAVALQGHGGWIQPERGMIPMNWGVDPALYERYSGMMEYFYETATSNDYFFTAPSGWGYAHPSHMTPSMASNYVRQINRGQALSDTDYIDIWWIPHKGPVWDAFARGMNMKGLTQWYNPRQKVGFKEANFPVIYGNHYYTLSEPAEFARRLQEDYKDHNGPWFIAVYGANRHLTPYKAKAVMELLPPDRFKAVRLDEFFTAARLARKEVEGKTWTPRPDTPVGHAP